MGIYYKNKLFKEDTSNHYTFEKFKSGYKVNTNVGVYAFTSLSKQRFEKIYKKYWNKIIVDCKIEYIDDVIVKFDQNELFEIKQNILMDHIYIYSLNDTNHIKITKSDLNHSLTWDVVKRYSIKKYGEDSNLADIVASNTIGIDLKTYKDWKLNRELWENR